MSSHDGLPRASVDTALLADPKIIALARRQRDPVRTAATVALYLGAVLASWREDRPVSVADAAPGWFLDPVDEYVADLAAAGLTNAAGLVSKATLDRWMGGVHARVRAGRTAAIARWSDADAMRSQSDGNASHTREEKRGEEKRGERTAPARDGAQSSPVRFADVMLEMGLDPAIAGRSEPPAEPPTETPT